MPSGEATTLPIESPSAAAHGACFLCGRDAGRKVWEENSYDVKYCAGCGVAYLDPAPPPGHVDPTFEQHDESYYARPAKVRADWLQKVRPSGRLLEVGCGSGEFLAECRRRGYEVQGCDPDAIRAQHCQEKLGIPVEVACVEQSNLPPESFDIVFHVDLLSHFPDPIEALRAMTRLVRPGGILCFEVGTLAGVSPYWYKWNGGLACPDHRWFFSLNGIRNVLDRAGLRIDRLKQFGLVPAMMPLVLGRSLVKPIARMIHGKDARPWDGVVEEGQPLRKVHGIYRLGQWVEFQLRYRLGPYVPKRGPTTLFIAASRK